MTPQYRHHFPARSGGAIIVTPEGRAYLPASMGMTPDEYLDWPAGLNVSLPPMPPRRYLARAA